MADKHTFHFEDDVKVELDGDYVTVSITPMKFRREKYIRYVAPAEEAYRVVNYCRSPNDVYRDILTKVFREVRIVIHPETPD